MEARELSMSFPDSRPVRWRARAGLALVLVLGLGGCNGPYTGEVSGTVKYKDKPLPGGEVFVYHPDGRTAFARIQEDGTYLIPAAPGGDVKVTVTTKKPIPAVPDFLNPGARNSTRKSETVYPTGPYVPIPPKYGVLDTTPLKTTVNRGSQTYDIELVD
jgi:hypothetical protein